MSAPAMKMLLWALAKTTARVSSSSSSCVIVSPSAL